MVLVFEPVQGDCEPLVLVLVRKKYNKYFFKCSFICSTHFICFKNARLDTKKLFQRHKMRYKIYVTLFKFISKISSSKSGSILARRSDKINFKVEKVLSTETCVQGTDKIANAAC